MGEVALMSEEYSPPAVWEDPEAAGKPIDLLVVLATIFGRWPFIVAAGATGLLIALVIAFSLTPEFTSKAVFLPPTQHVSSTDNPFAALLKTPSTAIYGELLLSESALGEVVEQCNLRTILKAKDEVGARERLRSMTKVSTDSSGFVSLQVTHRDPKLAQKIASTFLSALAHLNDRMAVASASQQRRVYEDALGHEKDELENAEVELKKIQESSGVILPQNQTLAGLSAIDRIRAEIRAQQVQLSALLQAATEQAPEVVRARAQIQALEAQLHLQENGKAGAVGESLTASNAPSVNLEFVRREREVKYHQVLFDVMAKQYENARLDESSAAPAVQIVDFPEVPLRKSWPPRALFALGGGVLGVFAAIVWIFMADRLRALDKEPEMANSLNALSKAIAHPRFWA